VLEWQPDTVGVTDVLRVVDGDDEVLGEVDSEYVTEEHCEPLLVIEEVSDAEPEPQCVVDGDPEMELLYEDDTVAETNPVPDIVELDVNVSVTVEDSVDEADAVTDSVEVAHDKLVPVALLLSVLFAVVVIEIAAEEDTDAH
jgi:hypothetical protein